MADFKSAVQADSGVITAEFAVVLPTVVAILVLSLGLLSAQVQTARLQQVSAVASHALARSEDQKQVEQWVHRHAAQARLRTSSKDGVLCTTVEQSLRFVISMQAIQVAETSCAWIGIPVSDG